MAALSRAPFLLLALAAPAWLGVPVRAAEAPRVDAPLAIRDARLVTVSGAVIDRGTLVVEDGLIAALGADVEPPAGAWVIEGAGLTVYPGLIDGLAALPLVMPSQPSGNEAPISRGPEDRPGTTPWLRAADLLDASSLEKWRRAGFAAAVVAPRVGIVRGQAALVSLAGHADDWGRGSDVVADRVALRVETAWSGPSWRGFPSSLMGIEAYLRQLFIDARYFAAATHRYAGDPLGMRRPEYDRALVPLAEMIGAGTPILLPARSRTEIERALALAHMLESKPIVYGGHEGFDAAAQLAAAGAPVVVSLDWPAAAKDPDPAANETLSALRLRDRAPSTPEALRQAGVPFAFATEALDDPTTALAAVKTAIDAGLPRDAAVRALTLGAAEIYGVADRMGTLEVGKIANLLVTQGELFTAGARLDRVVVDGRVFELEGHDGAKGEGSGETAPAAGAPIVESSLGEPPSEAATGGSQPGAVAPPSTESPSAATPSADTRETPSAAASVAPDEAPPAPAAEPARGEHQMTLIRNATVLTVTRGEIAGGEVLVRDGKIAAVGHDLHVPAHARVIDAGGGFVMPGIIDCHSHIAIDGDVNESSVAVSSMVAVADVLDPTDPDIYRALAGGVTTANILHGSANPIGGTNAVIKLRWGADAHGLLFAGAPPGIKFALGENPKRSNTGVREGQEGRYPATRMGVLDVIRQAFTEARAYQEEWRRYADARAEAEKKKGAPLPMPPRRDLRLEPLVEVLEGRRLVHAHAYRADEMVELMRLATELGFKIATLQHALEGYRIADEIKAHGAGVSTFSDRWAYKVEAWEAIPYNAALLSRRGIVVSINSDSAEEMRHLNQEAAKAMKWGGLSETEALALVTINPATQLGIADRVGSIEKGKDADLVIFDRHPLSIYAVVQKTIVDGQVMFDRAADLAARPWLAAEKKALEEKLGASAKSGAAGAGEAGRKPTTAAGGGS